ncbi:hypothetical protein EV361DRAFT_956743 [Lentinula raphanica]|nr:hypothetical protein EV361DRAFT_956743 [Lentinula raphanica]
MDTLQLTLTEAQTLLAFLSSSTPVQLPAELATLSARLQTQLSSTRATSNPSLGTRENCQLLPVDSGAGSPTPDVPQSLQPPDDLIPALFNSSTFGVIPTHSTRIESMSDDYVWNPLSSTPSPSSPRLVSSRRSDLVIDSLAFCPLVSWRSLHEGSLTGFSVDV